MSIETQYLPDNQTLLINISGHFDFSLSSAFRKTYENLLDNAQNKQYVIDLRNVSTIDSSALGMLLIMRSYVGETGNAIKIVNCNKFISKIFQITHFDKMFSIEMQL